MNKLYIAVCLFFCLLPCQSQTQLTRYEYWFDNVSATKKQQTLSSATSADVNTLIATPGLPVGIHTFQIRFQDSKNKWSVPASSFFVKIPVSNGVTTTITSYEYWFDNDFNTKKTQSVTASESLSVIADLATTNLTSGIHTLQVRFKDSKGKWSVPASSFFVKMPVNNGVATSITSYEYWFDNDFKTKKTQSVTASENLSVIADLATTNLVSGIHTLQVRFKDSKGKWSVPASSFFVKMPVNNGVATSITSYEYWFDNDFKTKKTQSVTANENLSVIADLATTNLPSGIHTLQVRFKDSKGKWSVPSVHIFLKPEATQQAPATITRYRYWFNNDFAHRTDITVDPVNPLKLSNMSIPVVGVNKIMPDNYSLKIDSVGGNKIVYHPHQLFNIQFKDSRNRWSSTSIDTVRYNYEVDLKSDTLISKVAKNIVMPTTDTLHIYKTAALAGDSLALNLRSMGLMTKLTLDIFDSNGDKLKSVPNYNITAGVRVNTDGIYYIAIHGFKNGFGQYTLNYTRIDRILPNLHVQSVTAQDAVANTKTKISWTVKNDGTATSGTSTWRDRIWLVKDITKDFSTTGVLLHDVQNLKSLAVGESYKDSTEIIIPERYEGKYKVVVMSDMNGVTSINWAPAGGTVPENYSPSVSGTPYPYLFATINANYNKLLELSEKTNLSDNFFYKAINISLPPLADLQVSSIDVPATLIAERKATISAIITNKGNVDITVGKSFVNKLYWTKDATFNKNTATLLTSKAYSGGLVKDASQSIQFTFTVPSDSVNQIRFFVETDALDSIFELDQTNNVSSSNWLKLKANTIQSADYAVLKNFYASAGGSAWTTKWNTASNVINSTNWYGVSFNEGYVTSIALPSNNITATFPVGLGSLDSLITLQLSFNKLSGEIPSLTNKFYSLKNLNLSDNQFSSMASALPASITNVSLGYQQFLVDSLHLSVSPTISLPQILSYNHSAKAFSTKPSFVIFDGYSPVGNLWYNASGEPEMSWNNANGWTYKSGKVFTLNQNNGSTYGSNAALKIYYNYGDANVDKQISILDVQHTLNYMLGEPATPFNFSAADTYCDTLITVQDIVKTINILLNEVVPVGPPENTIRKIKANNFSPATVYITDNKLILKTTVPVAAFDVTLSGLTETQLQYQLADYGFSVITRKQKDGSIRFVAFSASGGEIPVGNTCIADVKSENVQLKQVVLSNKQAQAIAVEVSEEKNTDVGNNWADVMAISSNQAKVNLKIPSGFETVDVVVYNPQGVEIAHRNLQAPMAGSYQFDFGTDIRTQGVYFIKVMAKTNKITSTINSKIIVSK